MANLLDLLKKQGSVFTNLDGNTAKDQYAADMNDSKSLHQVNGPTLNTSVLDLDAKTPNRYTNPETGTTYP
jgi:hypothetical protein